MSVKRTIKTTYNIEKVVQIAKKLGMTVAYNTSPKMYYRQDKVTCDVVIDGTVGFTKNGLETVTVFDDMYAEGTLEKLLPNYIKEMVSPIFTVKQAERRGQKLIIKAQRSY